MTLYIDGVWVNSSLASKCYNITDYPAYGEHGIHMHIGLEHNVEDTDYKGYIDEVMIINDTLTIGQVEAMYNGGTPRFDLIDSTQTNRRDLWKVNVYPNDEYKSGIPKYTNTINITPQKDPPQEAQLPYV